MQYITLVLNITWKFRSGKFEENYFFIGSKNRQHMAGFDKRLVSFGPIGVCQDSEKQ